MTKLSILLAALYVNLSVGAASGQGMGMHHSSSSGGVFGSSAAAPGTNSLGTALPTSGVGKRRMRGPPLGTGNPAVDREDARVAKMLHSICRGC
jgi:hypothetical protein